MTPDQFRAIFPAADADAWAPAITAAWDRWGFTSRNARAGYLGICGAETGGFVEVRRESMHYSLERAIEVFSKARHNPGISANRIYRGVQAFANWIYAYVNGNGDEDSGDGWKFRGAGIIQLTGRSNFRANGDLLGIDLVADPERVVRDPETSAASAAAYMATRGVLAKISQDGEAAFLEGAALVGYPADDEATERRLHFRREALRVLGDAATAPQPRDLKLGDAGEDVRALQHALNAADKAMLDEDGDFGSLTMLAVRHAQSQRGLVADGVVGPLTRAALGLST